MRKARFFASGTLVIVSSAAMAVMAGIFPASDSSWVRPNILQAGQAPQTPVAPTGPAFEARTRLVIIDAVATNGHGNVVSDLKPEEFQVTDEKNRPQKIRHFEFIDKSKETGPAEEVPQPGAAKVYSNQRAFERLKVPPTILLMDALNTRPVNQMSVRRHMVLLLKTLPSDTPVAVLLLSPSLRVVQSFTSDPALLRAAVDKVLSASIIEANPQDDDSMSSFFDTDISSDQGTEATLNLADFEKEVYALSLDIRVQQTVDALTSIAHFLSGYAGRKSLIWFSESFPFSITPDTQAGGNPFRGTREYSEKVQAAANALSDAQVAVYPVDAQGLATQQTFAASTSVGSVRRPDAGLGARLQREQNTRNQSQGTMEEIAKDTGGKTCKNTNDLSGCVTKALKDSSSYYELGFYPEDVNWDGSFHRIHLKTARHGVELDYRRGYFARDWETLAGSQKPEERLQHACADWLPSTSIPLTAQPELTASVSQSPGHLKYLLSVRPVASIFPPPVELGTPSLRLGICEFNEKGSAFHVYTTDIRNSEAGGRTLEPREVRGEVDIAPQPDTRRVRFVVLDLRSGMIGGLDVPVRPQDLSRASPPSRPATPAPAPAKPVAAPPPATTLTFTSGAGQSGVLDWTGDKVDYHGDLPPELAAPAFFNNFYRPRFHCESGALVANDPTGHAPSLNMTFHTNAGKSVTVDLKGNQPEYSGDLPVDDTAKHFFHHLLEACHCQLRPGPP